MSSHAMSEFALFDSAFGPLALVVREGVIAQVHVGWTDGGALRGRLSVTGSEIDGIGLDPKVREVGEALVAYLGGGEVDPATIAGPIAPPPARTGLRSAIYECLRRIPRGETVRYAELAARAGAPGAARAVGSAMAQNPLPLLWPCHRVLGAQGLGGYSAPGELQTKRRLLALEGIDLPPTRRYAEPMAESL